MFDRYLSIAVPPQPKDEVTLYGFVLGQPGDITVNFTANPRPSNVAWKLDSETELQVEPFSSRSSDPRVEVTELRNTVISYYFFLFPVAILIFFFFK